MLPVTSCLVAAGAMVSYKLHATRYTLQATSYKLQATSCRQLKSGKDVAIAALLGAEEFGFATAPQATFESWSSYKATSYKLQATSYKLQSYK